MAANLIQATPAPSVFTYTAKWICHKPLPTSFDPNAAELIGLTPGEYKTDINVHNPSLSSNSTIKRTFVVSKPELSTPPPPSGFISSGFTITSSVILAPGAAFFMDCTDILALFAQNGISLGAPVKGFVMLVTGATNLDVVAEYTSESFNQTAFPQGPFVPPGVLVPNGISIDIVRITPLPLSP